jgi:acyl-CoA reductase-like NAD-dependent aldehyde dehydrogenase
MIVLAGAPLERAANVAVYYGMMNAGQSCVSIERVYAEASIYDELVERIVADKVAALRVGAPAGPASVDVGAITAPRQLEIDRGARRRRAREGRARHRRRPAVEGTGRFFEPTADRRRPHDALPDGEETFGPTLPVMAVSGRRRGGRGGQRLADGAWRRRLRRRQRTRGEALARRLEVGAVCVNDAAVNYFALEAPMGGHRQSGIGVRHGGGHPQVHPTPDDSDRAALDARPRTADVPSPGIPVAGDRTAPAAPLRALTIERRLFVIVSRESARHFGAH